MKHNQEVVFRTQNVIKSWEKRLDETYKYAPSPDQLSIDVAFDMICQAESEVISTKNHNTEISAIYVNHPEESNKNNARGGLQRGRNKLFCTHCQGSGHTKEFCYDLVGYPPEYRRGRGASRGPSGGGKGSGELVEALVMVEGHILEGELLTTPLFLNTIKWKNRLSLLQGNIACSSCLASLAACLLSCRLRRRLCMPTM